MTGLVMYDNIEVGKFWYSLKGLIRCHQSHFTCAIHSEDKWLFFDDLVQTVKTFPTLEAMQRQIPIGSFFAVFELNDQSSKIEMLLRNCSKTPETVAIENNYQNNPVES